MTSSRRYSLSNNPRDRDLRAKSSFTQSGNLHFNSDVALPISGGKPVERENITWEELAVSSMLLRIKGWTAAEYQRRIADLGDW